MKAVRVASLWLLRAAVVAYGGLIIAIRLPAAAADAEGPGSASEITYWAFIALLTFLPLVYALWLSARSIFFCALVVALYATVDVFALPQRDRNFVELFYGYEQGAGTTVLRVFMLLGLWILTLWFARLDASDGPQKWRAQGLRVTGALFLVYGAAAVMKYWAATGGVSLFNTGSMLVLIGSFPLAVLLASRFVPRQDPGEADIRMSRGSALGWGALGGLATASLAVGLASWRDGSWFPDLPRLPDGAEGADLVFTPVFVTLLAAAEEWGFRGVLWRACTARFGALPTLVLTSTAFGLFHLPGGPLTAMPEKIVMGIVFGCLRWKTNRLWPCIVAHALANSLLMGFAPAG